MTGLEEELTSSVYLMIRSTLHIMLVEYKIAIFLKE